MTVNELIEALQEVAENGGGEREVLLATQPHYPLAHTISGIADGEERLAQAAERFKHLWRLEANAPQRHDEILDEVAEEFDLDSDAIDAARDENPAGPIWILEGGHPEGSPYASKNLWNR